MGTWGTGIFADDTASDVKGDWREALMDGLEPDAATRKVLSEYAESLSDPDERIVVVLALAAAQVETGRLQSDIRDQALQLIAGGADLNRWREESPGDVRARERALTALASKLTGPQNAPTTLKRPRPRLTPFEIGDVAVVRNPETGATAVLIAIAIADSWPPGSTDAVWSHLLCADPPSLSHTALKSAPYLLRVVQGDNPDDPRPLVEQVHGASRGRLAFKTYGEIVARGVTRDDVPDVPFDRLHTNWANVAAFAGSEWQQRCRDRTLQHTR